MECQVIKPTVWNCGRFHFDWGQNISPVVMGILNITPDSFSDGGQFLDQQKALDHAWQMIEDGATIIDLGGESTRPGAKTVSAQEEQDRVLPILEKLQNAGVALSIDTYKSQTMQYALQTGVDILNDISGFRDPANLAVATSSKTVGLCVMHMQNTPATMQINPQYANVLEDVRKFFAETLLNLSHAGIASNRIALDPGFGFGKTVEHNLHMLHRLEIFKAFDTALLVGLSRKKMISHILGSPNQDKTVASVAAALLAVERGANIIRVHDVRATVDAVRVWTAMRLERLT